MIATARSLVLGASLLLASSAWAAWEVKLGPVSGEVHTQAARGKRQAAREGQTLAAGTRIQTGPGGSATLEFDDGARVELEGDAALVLTAPPKKKGVPPVRFTLSQGAATASAQSVKGAFVIKVPAGSVWLFGAQAKLEVDGPEVRVSAEEGRVEVATVGRAAKLGAGQGVVAQKGKAPQKPYALEAEAQAPVPAEATPQPQEEEKTAEQPIALEGLGLDLTESPPPPAPQETEAEDTPQATASPAEEEPGQEPAAPAPPMALKFRAGVDLAPGGMFGLPNLFAGGTLKARGQLALFPWLELGVALGFGEWIRLGELVADRPGYAALATLEAELAVRIPFGAPFAELGIGYRGYTVEVERRGYLVETSPLLLTLGGGYRLNLGLPLDVMLRLGALPGTRTVFVGELHALLWVF